MNDILQILADGEWHSEMKLRTSVPWWKTMIYFYGAMGFLKDRGYIEEKNVAPHRKHAKSRAMLYRLTEAGMRRAERVVIRSDPA